MSFHFRLLMLCSLCGACCLQLLAYQLSYHDPAGAVRSYSAEMTLTADTDIDGISEQRALTLTFTELERVMKKQEEYSSLFFGRRNVTALVNPTQQGEALRDPQAVTQTTIPFDRTPAGVLTAFYSRIPFYPSAAEKLGEFNLVKRKQEEAKIAKMPKDKQELELMMLDYKYPIPKATDCGKIPYAIADLYDLLPVGYQLSMSGLNNLVSVANSMLEVEDDTLSAEDKQLKEAYSELQTQFGPAMPRWFNPLGLEGMDRFLSDALIYARTLGRVKRDTTIQDILWRQAFIDLKLDDDAASLICDAINGAFCYPAMGLSFPKTNLQEGDVWENLTLLEPAPGVLVPLIFINSLVGTEEIDGKTLVVVKRQLRADVVEEQLLSMPQIPEAQKTASLSITGEQIVLFDVNAGELYSSTQESHITLQLSSGKGKGFSRKVKVTITGKSSRITEE